MDQTREFFSPFVREGAFPGLSFFITHVVWHGLATEVTLGFPFLTLWYCEK